MTDEELLAEVRNYLDITYLDVALDEKLSGIIARGKNYLDNIAGAEQGYGEGSFALQLLLDYCRYARNNVLEYFEENYRRELLMLRIGVQASDYAKQKGYV